jgi:elongation factor P
MHPETFEQVYVSGTMLGDNAAFLQENMEVNLQIFNVSPVSATLPPVSRQRSRKPNRL